MSESPPIQVSPNSILTLRVHGVGNIVAFKNKKRAIRDRSSGKMRTLTDPKTAQQMERMSHAFESQFASCIQIPEGETWTAQQVRSWIRSSLPSDDSRQCIAELVVNSRDVSKGEEGCEVIIERLT